MRAPTISVLAVSLFLVVATANPTRAALEELPSAVGDADYQYDGAPPRAKVELGRMLFFDKILSGNRNISCATCHHPDLGSTDRLSLPLGEGARGLGPDRRTDGTVTGSVHGRVPRNSQALFNVGAREFTRLFHDGRVEADREGFYEGGFITPARWKLPVGLDNVLAAQAMFPVVSEVEMAGQRGENDVADCVATARVAGHGGAWDILAGRLRAIPEYVELFCEAYPGEVESAQDVTYVHAANAIAAFETVAFRADDSPFDRYLRGSRDALAPSAKRGLALFYGKAGCGGCHSGSFQTDHGFHAVAMPQIGPGKGDGRNGEYWRTTGQQAFLEDLGRGRVTMRPEDDFAFRTPSLRNVALTGPWGHAGTHDDLESVVRHHLDPESSLRAFDSTQVVLPDLGRVLELTAAGSRFEQSWLSDNRARGFAQRDTWVQRSAVLRGRILQANELARVELTDDELADVIEFLHALTDSSSPKKVASVPDRVPSGLPVQD